MKRRKKVWVVVGPHGGMLGIYAYRFRLDALDVRDRYGNDPYPVRVVSATLEYDIPPKKEQKP